MKKSAPLLLLVAMISFTGCSHQYVMKMSNGNKITTANKPKLENGYYVYKDARGAKHSVSQARVVEIAPSSIAAEETAKPKKK